MGLQGWQNVIKKIWEHNIICGNEEQLVPQKFREGCGRKSQGFELLLWPEDWVGR